MGTIRMRANEFGVASPIPAKLAYIFIKRGVVFLRDDGPPYPEGEFTSVDDALEQVSVIGLVFIDLVEAHSLQNGFAEKGRRNTDHLFAWAWLMLEHDHGVMLRPVPEAIVFNADARLNNIQTKLFHIALERPQRIRRRAVVCIDEGDKFSGRAVSTKLTVRREALPAGTDDPCAERFCNCDGIVCRAPIHDDKLCRIARLNGQDRFFDPAGFISGAKHHRDGRSCHASH